MENFCNILLGSTIGPATIWGNMLYFIQYNLPIIKYKIIAVGKNLNKNS